MYETKIPGQNRPRVDAYDPRTRVSVLARAIRIYKSPLAAGIEHKSPSPAKVGVRGDRIVDEDLVKQAWPIYSAYIKSNS